MKLFEHRQKLLTVSNFAEAYKRIETYGILDFPDRGDEVYEEVVEEK